MILYEVELEVDGKILPQFVIWLEEHRKEMLETGLFLEAYLYQNNVKPFLLKVSYTLKSRGDLEVYLEKWAPLMRRKTLEAFPEGFRAKRKVYEDITHRLN